MNDRAVTVGAGRVTARRRVTPGALAILLFVAWAITARAEIVPAVVTAVHDGDSMTALVHGRPEKVRLNAIDAPELAQPFGSQARDLLAARVLGKTVTLDTLPRRDKYRRIVATVWSGDRDECLAQVDAGAAWVFTRYLSKLPRERRALYLTTQTAAAAHDRGLWSQSQRLAPWDFRKAAKLAAAANRKR